MSARFPADIMATAVIPWTEGWTLDERRFRRELELMLTDGHRHIYIFGTAGEGYAVTDEQFLQITRVFVDGLRGSGVEPMVGVISLSLPTIIARIEAAYPNLVATKNSTDSMVRVRDLIETSPTRQNGCYPTCARASRNGRPRDRLIGLAKTDVWRRQ